MSQIKNKNILNIVLVFSILALIAAYFIQYILGHQPCNLCLIERIPYILAIIIISLIYIFKKNEKIQTEISNKFTILKFKNIIKATGWKLKKYWTDQKKYYAVFLLQS